MCVCTRAVFYTFLFFSQHATQREADRTRAQAGLPLPMQPPQTHYRPGPTDGRAEPNRFAMHYAPMRHPRDLWAATRYTSAASARPNAAMRLDVEFVLEHRSAESVEHRHGFSRSHGHARSVGRRHYCRATEQTAPVLEARRCRTSTRKRSQASTAPQRTRLRCVSRPSERSILPPPPPPRQRWDAAPLGGALRQVAETP